MTTRTIVPRSTKGSVDSLLRRATSREPWKTADSLSGSALERVIIGGESFVLKHLHVDDDWIQRAQGDIYTRPVVMWTSGLFDSLPSCIDHTIVDIATGLGRNGWGAAILMRDVSPFMVDVSTGLIREEQHLRFLDHMADLHSSFTGFRDTFGLMPVGNRFYTLGPLMASYETQRQTEGVPNEVAEGWQRLAEEDPALGRIVLPLLDEPGPLVEALEAGPQTLVHSDWKAGNLGSHPDGRTILIDWAFPGCAPAAVDVAWYLAVNCELLPHSKEDAIDAYRSCLKRRNDPLIDSGWWGRQLELALLGATLLLGWSKTGDELRWWAERAPRALHYL